MRICDNPVDRPLRFGVCLTARTSRKEFIEKCRTAEAMGYDVIGVVDHLGMWAPFPALMLAAEATERPRIATAVLNTAFYNAGLLARDVATMDLFTDGRFDLGLGTGYMRAEFEAAGLPCLDPRRRVDRLERMVTDLRRLLAGDDHRVPPVWLAGRGDRLLALAVREADIIGFNGFAAGRDGIMGDLATVDGVAERVRYVRDLLGASLAAVELNLLVWRVIVTNDRRAAAERLGPARSLTVDELLQVPTVLIGTPAQIAEQLVEYRERFGFTYITVGEYNLEALASVIEVVR